MSEAIAHVLHVTAAVHRVFGDDHIIMTTDGLEVKDSSGTQGILHIYLLIFELLSEYMTVSFNTGLRFWKVNSRKFSTTEEDLQAPTHKRSKRMDVGVDELEAIREDLGSLNDKIDKIFAVTKDVQPGSKLFLSDALRCKIYLDSPAKPLIILAKCCKSILGCQQCVDGWYEDGGLTKSCPACRSLHGLTETILRPRQNCRRSERRLQQ